jgi:hypothetical protein
MDKISLGINTLWRITRNAFVLRYKNNIKLNFGAGGSRMGDYINIDSLFMRETDLLCELKNIPFFVRSGSVSHIYASHVFEHFTLSEVEGLLRMSYDLLQRGGEIRISVPPITWLGVIYGGQSTKYDFHKVGFNEPLLSTLLHQAGFLNISRYDAAEFLAQHNAKDTSLYKKDFGEYISLNIVAYK